MRVFGFDPLDLVRYNGQALLWDRAWRGAITVAVPIAAGVAFGNPELGLIATLCALWPWLNDLGGEIRDRLINMATSGDAILLGGLLAWIAGDNFWAKLGVLFLCAVVIGWAHNTSRGLENAARCMGFSFIIVASLDLASWALILPAFAGAAWAMLVAWADERLRRTYAVETGGSVRAGLHHIHGEHAADWRFGLRYAVAAALGLLLAKHFGATHAAWVTITTLAVMRPNDSESVQLVLQRGFGTAIGVGIALFIVSLDHSAWHLTAAAAVLAFCISPGLIWQRWAGFAAITAMALVLLDMALLTQGGDRPLLSERIYDTGLGCIIALVTTWVIFPTRWRAPVKASRT
ncbi:MAG TPA: FUSC family protein [Stellaceae bacterium]|nr:FUSC family protein [Stellaceae bacterium]